MIAVGTDILKVSRIEAVVGRLGDKFVRRILTPAEVAEYDASSLALRLLAKRFAAKEAVAKALGTGIGRGVSWQDIRVHHDDNGAPLVELNGGALEACMRRGGDSIALSISDEAEYVLAFAVLWRSETSI
ncbi:MAG: holo-ACP synthase [Halieaceae bacterium]